MSEPTLPPELEPEGTPEPAPTPEPEAELSGRSPRPSRRRWPAPTDARTGTGARAPASTRRGRDCPPRRGRAGSCQPRPARGPRPGDPGGVRQPARVPGLRPRDHGWPRRRRGARAAVPGVRGRLPGRLPDRLHVRPRHEALVVHRGHGLVHRLRHVRRGVQGGEQRPRGGRVQPDLGRASRAHDGRRAVRRLPGRRHQRLPARVHRPGAAGKAVEASWFEPRLCMQCANSPCTGVCPVGATYKTPDGVILVDARRCIGCGYCVVACPYGARYLTPAGHSPTGTGGVADKCTWCYHRISRGQKPACVEVCPVGARRFGEASDPEMIELNAAAPAAAAASRVRHRARRAVRRPVRRGGLTDAGDRSRADHRPLHRPARPARRRHRARPPRSGACRSGSGCGSPGSWSSWARRRSPPSSRCRPAGRSSGPRPASSGA